MKTTINSPFALLSLLRLIPWKMQSKIRHVHWQTSNTTSSGHAASLYTLPSILKTKSFIAFKKLWGKVWEIFKFHWYLHMKWRISTESLPATYFLRLAAWLIFNWYHVFHGCGTLTFEIRSNMPVLLAASKILWLKGILYHLHVLLERNPTFMDENKNSEWWSVSLSSISKDWKSFSKIHCWNQQVISHKTVVTSTKRKEVLSYNFCQGNITSMTIAPAIPSW